MKTVRALILSFALIGLMTTQSGCLLAAAAVGTGTTVAYMKGDSEVTLEADPRQIANATESAMNDLDMAVVSSSSSGVDAKLVGRTARDTKLEVTVRAQTSKLSKINIRAGMFGDEALQARLLEKIKTHLAAPPTFTKGSPTTAPALTSIKGEQEDPRD